MRFVLLSLFCLVGCLHAPGASPPRRPTPQSLPLQAPSQPAMSIEGRAVGNRRDPSVAYNGKDFLVVWSDQRRWAGEKIGPTEIVAARLDANGAPIPGGQSTVALVEAYDSSLRAQVLACGAQWVIVFGSNRNGESISVVRLQADGTKVDAAPYRMGDFVGGGGFSAACTKDSLLVAWSAATQKGEATQRVWGALLPLQGELQEKRFQVSPKPATKHQSTYSFSYPPSVVFDGDHYWVAWSTNAEGEGYPNQLVASRLSPDGSPEPPLILGKGALAAAASIGGGRAIFAWPSLVENKGYQRVGVRVKNGALQDTKPFALDPGVSYDNTSVQIVALQNQYVASWVVNPHRLRGVTIPANGAASPAQDILARGQSLPYQSLYLQEVTQAATDNTIVWVWKELYAPVPRYPEDPKIMAALVAPSQFAPEKRTDTSATLLSTSINAQLDVAVGSRGSEHLVVWIDTREGVQRLYGAWLNANGEKSGEEFLLSPALLGACQSPRVIAGKRGYLVLWEGPTSNDEGLLGVWLAPLATSAPKPHFLARGLGGEERYDATFDGRQFQLVFLSYGDIRLQRWEEEAEPAAAVFIQPSGKNVAYRTSPVLSCDAKKCSVALAAVSGGNAWLETGAAKEKEPLKAMPERPTNHFIGHLAWMRSSSEVLWIEDGGSEDLLQLGELGRSGASIASSHKIPDVFYGPIQVVETSQGEAIFMVGRSWAQPPKIYLYRYDGASWRGGVWSEGSQFSIAENPAGGFIAAWITFDPTTQSNRVSVRLLSDQLESPP